MAGTVVFIEASSGDGGDPGATVSKVVDGSTVSGWVSSASVATNSDNFLTGTTSVSDKVSNSTQDGYGTGAGLVGEPWDFSVGGTDEGNHIWIIASISGTADTQVNGGFGIVVADDLATDSVGYWYVGPQAGSLGGWEYFVINPAADFDAVTAGTAVWTTTGNPAQLSGVDGMGVQWKVTNTVMGASDNAFLQSVSCGVGYRITGTNAVFSEISTYEETNRFGALVTVSGTLFPLCKIRVGTPSGAGNTTFSDTGFNVTWQGQVLSDGTTKATADGFYGFFVDQGTGTTDVTLTSGNLAAASPEYFDLALDGGNSVTCTNLSVDRARIVTLDGNVSWTGGTIKNSGVVDLNGQPTLSGITIQDSIGVSSVSSDAASLIINAANEMANVDGLVFDGAGVGGTTQDAAIEVDISGAGPFTIDLNNITFQNRVGSSVDLHILANGNADYTFNLLNGTATPTYTNDGSGTVTAEATVTVKVTAKDAGDQSNVSGARVLLEADTGGDLPAQETVTITASGTTATVAHTAHGAPDGSNVIIRNADQDAYNGSHTITVTTANEYTYTMGSSPSSPATIRAGETAITATSEIISTTTDGSGIAQNSSFVYTSPQPTTGKIRKGTASTYYKTSPVSGTITSTGLDTTAFLVVDE